MNLSPSKFKLGLWDRYFRILHQARTSDRILLHLLLASVVAGTLWALLTINTEQSELVAIPGGDITEGVIGYPRFINPILATTRADKDLTALMHSGVMRIDQRGELVPHLAESVTLNEAGTVYTITLRPDAYFHDGEKITATDVAFTYKLIQDPDVKSPLRGNWERVTIQAQDDQTITLTLNEPYTPFINNLTTGILPEHIWSNVATTELAFSTYNLEPVGAGPYAIDQIHRDKQNNITAYQLKIAPYINNEPYLNTVTLRFFPDTGKLATALSNGEITGTTDLSPKQIDRFASDNYQIIVTPLPQTFGVFFNQNRSSALRQSEVREALALSVDRETIITQATQKQALPTHLPIPSGFATLDLTQVASTSVHRYDMVAAAARLQEAGWEQNENNVWVLESDEETLTLSLTLRTLNEPVLEVVAEKLAANWRSLGAEVKIEQYEQSDLLNAVIRPREFEVVLFGMDVGRGVDLYPFWHSSQQTDPGLNIAQYANISADKELEILRTSTDETVRTEALSNFTNLLTEEIPAIFLYTPTMQYVTTNTLTTTTIPTPAGPHDRLQFITNWHRERATLWPIFHSEHAITKQ